VIHALLKKSPSLSRAMDALGAVFRNLTQREQAQGLAIAGITLVLLFWGYHYLLPEIALRKIPQAGKHPGFVASLFGVGLADAKRDFKKNGLQILNEAYRKVSAKFHYPNHDATPC
jgi:hypothetical protein